MASSKRPKAVNRQAQREEILSTMRSAYRKLRKGKPLTEREARILKKGYDSFMELYNVFRPNIKETLIELGNDIEAQLDEAEIEDDD